MYMYVLLKLCGSAAKRLLLLLESCNVRASVMALQGTVVGGRHVYVPSIFHHCGEPLSPLTHT